MMNRQPENGHIGFRPPLLSPKSSLKMACGRLANILAEWKHFPHSVQPFGEEPSSFRFGFQAASGSWQTSQPKNASSFQLIRQPENAISRFQAALPLPLQKINPAIPRPALDTTATNSPLPPALPAPTLPVLGWRRFRRLMLDPA